MAIRLDMEIDYVTAEGRIRRFFQTIGGRIRGGTAWLTRPEFSETSSEA
jgi:hypothetical protein